MDRVGWAVACCAWFEGIRIGDFLKEERGDGVWRQGGRTHRGRVPVEDEEGGMEGGKKLVLQVLPTKIDQGNRSKFARSFGWVILERICRRAERSLIGYGGDLVGGNPRVAPLFRHPEKGGEMSTRCFGRW